MDTVVLSLSIPLSRLRSGAFLPPEILALIFLRALTPKFLLDPSLARGCDSPWSKIEQTKLSLSAVCRSWNLVMTRFLYEDVAFRRFEQIPGFLRTIKAVPSHQTLVKDIAIHAFIPFEDDCGSLFTIYLQDIVDNCPSLKSFSVLSPLLSLGPAVGMPTLNSGITHLSFNDITSAILLLIEFTRDTLISLSILNHGTNFKFNNGKPLLFPNLVDLAISIGFDSRALGTLLGTLRVPGLHSFTFSSSEIPEEFAPEITLFLEMYGSHVHFLRLQAAGWEGQGEYIQTFIDACPVLEHFAIYPGNVIQITHPNVRWLDIGIENGFLPTLPWTRSKAEAAFPKLMGFRRVISPFALFQTLSATLPPDLVMSDHEGFDLTFPGILLKYTHGTIYLESFINDPKFAEDDDSSDYEYSEYSEDSDSSSDGSQCSILQLDTDDEEIVQSMKNTRRIIGE